MRKLNLYTLTALLATCAGCTDSLPDNGEPSSSALQLVSVGLAETAPISTAVATQMG